MSEYLIYLRKSRQDNPNETVEEVLLKHEIQLQEYALSTFKYRIPEEDIYREVVSGETIDDRPMIQKVLKKIESSEIKGVLVIDCQRLTRGDMLDCGMIVHSFRYTNTLIVTPQKTYDLNDKFDRKFFEMELSRGSDYLDYTKEILERGRRASTKRGNYIHSIPPYGYKRVKVGKDWILVPDEVESNYVKLAFKLFSEGYGANYIANRLTDIGAEPRNQKIFSTSTVRQMLQNPVYIGKLKINNRITEKVVENGKLVKKRIRSKNYDIVDGKHEALIDDKTFYAAQERFKNNPRTNTDLEIKNIFAGILKCGICGRAIGLVPYSNKSRRVDRYKCTDSIHCGNISHRYDDINSAIIEQLKSTLSDFEMKYKESENDENNKEFNSRFLDSLNKQLDDNSKKLENICKYLEDGIYTAEMFISRKKALEEEKEKISKAIKELSEKNIKRNESEEKIIALHKALEMLNDDSISAKIKNDFLRSFIKVIYYKKEMIAGETRINISIILK